MDPNDSSWVDERMQALDPPDGWQPDAAAARSRPERRRALRRRVWIGAGAAAALCLAVFFFRPAGRVIHPAPSAGARAAGGYRESGSARAPIAAEIYSDYECSYCATLFEETVPKLMAEYVATGKMRLRHRDLPLPQHAWAREAARWADAAGQAGYYEEAVSQLFRTQGRWGADGDIESRLAEGLSRDAMAAVRANLKDTREIDAAIDADVRMAIADNVRMTPTLVVTANGRRRTIAPVPPYALLKSYLDDLLRAACRENPGSAGC